MNKYQELIRKSEQATACALKANSDWARFYWSDVADKLKEQAMDLPLSEAGNN